MLLPRALCILQSLSLPRQSRAACAELPNSAYVAVNRALAARAWLPRTDYLSKRTLRVSL